MLNNQNENIAAGEAAQGNKRGRGLLRRLFRDKAGTSAIEFALLALPFMVVVFASLETFVAFTAEQLFVNATDNLARKVRTGEITAANTTKEQFRKMFCDEISVLMTCSANEAKIPTKLYIDVRSFATFAQIPTTVPRKNGNLDTTAFQFSLGGPTTVTMGARLLPLDGRHRSRPPLHHQFAPGRHQHAERLPDGGDGRLPRRELLRSRL